MRKLLGLAVLLVALPACATARSIGALPADALGELGCTVSGACAPVATVKPLAAPAATPATPTHAPRPLTQEERELLERPPADLPSLAQPSTTVGGTQLELATPWTSAAARSDGVGLEIPLAPDVCFGPALEWSSASGEIVDERLTLGLIFRF